MTYLKSCFILKQNNKLFNWILLTYIFLFKTVNVIHLSFLINLSQTVCFYNKSVFKPQKVPFCKLYYRLLNKHKISKIYYIIKHFAYFKCFEVNAL